jgi:hypothetical protein
MNHAHTTRSPARPCSRRLRVELLMALDAHAAAARLSVATRSWATVPPNASELENAGLAAEELRAIIAELQRSRAFAEKAV